MPVRLLHLRNLCHALRVNDQAYAIPYLWRSCRKGDVHSSLSNSLIAFSYSSVLEGTNVILHSCIRRLIALSYIQSGLSDCLYWHLHDEREQHMHNSLLSISLMNQQDENAVPHIAITGANSVVKTSTLNELFGAKIPIDDGPSAKIPDWNVSLSDATLPKIRNGEVIQGKFGQLILVDMPMLGMDRQQDLKSLRLYKRVLPSVDVLLWVLHAQRRTEDVQFEQCLGDLKQRLGRGFNRIIFGINDIEELPGLWLADVRLPDAAMRESIRNRVAEIKTQLKSDSSQVVPYSAKHRFGLIALVRAMLEVAPFIHRRILLRSVDIQDQIDQLTPEARRDTDDFLRKYY